jgi:catechol 2,3-dioxygenase-like lactoylglutathione lyase family enzyme
MDEESVERGLLNGLERVVYGVADLGECRRFFIDWGLEICIEGPDRCVFQTMDGTEVELRRIDDPTLPPAIEPGSTVREVVWGVRNARDLERLRSRLIRDGAVSPEATGSLRCTDPSGVSLGFQISKRRPVNVVGSPTNAMGRTLRIDQPSTLYASAKPVRLSHVVFNVINLAESLKFYTGPLGLVVSDSYPEHGYFMRCQSEGGHHNLFLVTSRTGTPGLNHVSFMVRDIYEVFGGGLQMERQGWKSEIGPGRHPISSAIFWYFRGPCGGLVEYYADEDHLTSKWVPRTFDRTLENFAEWAIAGGISYKTRRQN